MIPAIKYNIPPKNSRFQAIINKMISKIDGIICFRYASISYPSELVP